MGKPSYSGSMTIRRNSSDCSCWVGTGRLPLSSDLPSSGRLSWTTSLSCATACRADMECYEMLPIYQRPKTRYSKAHFDDFVAFHYAGRPLRLDKG